jgi:hypothetical protein
VSLRKKGSQPCSLRGRVRVRFLDGSDPAGVDLTTLAPQRPEPGVPVPSLRALRRGESAFVQIWWSNWCGEPTPTRLGLRLPSGDEIDLALGEAAPRCHAPGSPSSLAVGPPEPRPAEPRPSTRLPLAPRSSSRSASARRSSPPSMAAAAAPPSTTSRSRIRPRARSASVRAVRSISRAPSSTSRSSCTYSTAVRSE